MGRRHLRVLLVTIELGVSAALLAPGLASLLAILAGAVLASTLLVYAIASYRANAGEPCGCGGVFPFKTFSIGHIVGLGALAALPIVALATWTSRGTGTSPLLSASRTVWVALPVVIYLVVTVVASSVRNFRALKLVLR
jgi:hypothetical protein